MKKKGTGPRILYVQQEFYRWNDARLLSYDWSLGIEEGFSSMNLEFKTVLMTFMEKAKEVLKNERFDQVWVNDIIHSVEEVTGCANRIEFQDLEWLRSLAPTMVGILYESIEYTDEEIKSAPNLLKRAELIKQIAPYYTHIVSVDEHDVELFKNSYNIASLWTPIPALPKYVNPSNQNCIYDKALFSGTNYILRNHFIQNEELMKYLQKFESQENYTEIPQLFDSLNSIIINNTDNLSWDSCQEYLNSIRKLRRKSYQFYLEGLQTGKAVVNLPSYLKGYTSRVIEGMAAKRPVISWRVPDRPKNSALFEEGKDILLFDKNDTGELIRHIKNCLSDQDYCKYLSDNAYSKLTKYHTTEHRVKQILEWIMNGKMPDYGEVENLDKDNGKIMQPDDHSDAYYVEFFTKDPNWSAPEANEDEMARWSKISSIIDHIIESDQSLKNRSLRLLDVGCGRGWLVNLLSKYGEADGVEPVAGVVSYARKLYPGKKFLVGSTKQVLSQPAFSPYDIVVSTEVIEHIPDNMKSEFVSDIKQLLKPEGGYVIVTTPRKEVLPILVAQGRQSEQPTEEWLSESDVKGMFLGQGLKYFRNEVIPFDLSSNSFMMCNDNRNNRPGDLSSNVIDLYQVWGFRKEKSIAETKDLRNQRIIDKKTGCKDSEELKTTVFILTIGDPVFKDCLRAVEAQNNRNFKIEIIRNVAPFSRAAQQMIEQCTTDYFIQVDEDMILDNDAVRKMEECMAESAGDIGMICFHLYDVDREQKIQGIKIYRTSLMKNICFNDLKASEMDIIRQMEVHNIKWLIHPEAVGKHGTFYTPESIYLRYKSMYEKDIRSWNIYTWDLNKKVEKFKKTGNILELFAVLGAAHGIINAPIAQDKEKDFRDYNSKTLEVFKDLLLKAPSYTTTYDPSIIKNDNYSNLIPYDSGKWKGMEHNSIHVKNNTVNDSLKILNTVEYYYPHIGGAEAVVQKISEELVKRGHSVTIATKKLSERNFAEFNGVQIKDFDVAGKAATGFSGKEVELYRDFLRNTEYDVMFNYAAQQWATDLAFESVLQNRNRVNIIAPCGYSALKDSKTIQWPSFSKYFNEYIPKIIPLYDAAVYHSANYKDYIFAKEHGFTNSVVIPNGAGEDEFLKPSTVNFREKYNVKSRYMGLCVANYVEGKGQERVIECIRQMNRPDFEMVFIGKEGNELSKLKTISGELNIRFLVNIPREDTIAAFHAADIFLFGSFVEAFPLVILESKASRTPFVSTDCGNINELKGGIICKGDEMAIHASKLLDDDDLRSELAREGYREWNEKYTWGSIVDRYEKLFLMMRSSKYNKLVRAQ